MQNTGTPKKLHDTTYNDQRRDLAPRPPQKNNELVAKCLNAFSQFVKYIDFSKL
jgi:hypothetical protein